MNAATPNPTLHRTLWLLLALVILGIFGLFIGQSWEKILKNTAEPLPSYGTVAPFALTESSGQTVTEKDLLGKVWVVDFFFTSCPGPCPVMSHKMQTLQLDLNKTDKVQLVSISIDPEMDTPEVLRAYAQRYYADPKKWIFLTGSEPAVHDLVEKSFRLPLTKNPDGDVMKFGRFLHSTRFVLVDAKGTIRGFYDSLDREFEPHLLEDIGTVMKEDGL